MTVNLSEYIHQKMDLLFVALNAPDNSNKNGHWFTNNLSFWNILYRTGIITKPITNMLEGDVKVFGDNTINYNNWNIGVTDLNRKDVETDSTKVEVNQDDVYRIIEIIKNNQVARVCLMHSNVGQAFREYTNINFNSNRYGLIGKLNETEIFEVPFHNATVANKDSYYALLLGEKNEEVIDRNTIEQPRKKEKKIISKNSKVESKEVFTIPTSGNQITIEDIKKGQLRITAENKQYFPNQNQQVAIKYLGKNYQVNFVHRDTRSHILNVGKCFMSALSITKNSRLKLCYHGGKYEIQKL
jgi:hypothetical protein